MLQALPPPRSLPAPAEPPIREACLMAAHLAAESSGLPLDEVLHTERRGRASASARALAMYLAHVGLGTPVGQVARAFRRHRSTVAHACRLIEEHREEPGCDRRIATLERRLRHELRVPLHPVMEAGHG